MSQEIKKDITKLDLIKELEEIYFSGIHTAMKTVKKIYDLELYKELGYKSFAEYAPERLHMSKTTAYVYLKSAQKQLPPGGITEEEYAELGRVKLDALNKLDTKLWEEIVGGKQIELNGNLIDFQQIKDMAATEFLKEARKSKNALKKERDKNVRLQEEVKLKDDELKHVKIDEKEIEHGKELETIFGGLAGKLEAKQNAIKAAEKHFMFFLKALTNAHVTAEDPETLRHQYYELHRTALWQIEWLTSNRHQIWVDLEDVPALPEARSQRTGQAEKRTAEYIERRLKKNPNFFADFEKLNNGKLHPSDPRLEGKAPAEPQSKAPAEPQPAAELGDGEVPTEPARLIRKDTTRMAIKVKSNGKYSHGWKNLESGFNSEQDLDKRFDELLQEPGTSDG